MMNVEGEDFFEVHKDEVKPTRTIPEVGEEHPNPKRPEDNFPVPETVNPYYMSTLHQRETEVEFLRRMNQELIAILGNVIRNLPNVPDEIKRYVEEHDTEVDRYNAEVERYNKAESEKAHGDAKG